MAKATAFKSMVCHASRGALARNDGLLKIHRKRQNLSFQKNLYPANTQISTLYDNIKLLVDVQSAAG